MASACLAVPLSLCLETTHEFREFVLSTPVDVASDRKRPRVGRPRRGAHDLDRIITRSSELESHSYLHRTGVGRVIGSSEKRRSQDAAGQPRVLRVESVVDVRENIHLRTCRIGASGPLELIRL